MLFVVFVFVAGWTWHRLYASGKSKRAGAIRQVFERWGADADPKLDREIHEFIFCGSPLSPSSILAISKQISLVGL